MSLTLIPGLIIISLLFFVVLLALVLYLLWLRGDIKKQILEKEENWLSVQHGPIEIQTKEEGESTASITFEYLNSSAVQTLAPWDKLWRKHVKQQDGTLVSSPVEEDLELCVDGSHVVAYRYAGSKKHHRFSEPSSFLPAIGPPNPLSVNHLQKENKVWLWLVVLLVPAGICWLLLLFSLILY